MDTNFCLFGVDMIVSGETSSKIVPDYIRSGCDSNHKVVGEGEICDGKGSDMESSGDVKHIVVNFHLLRILNPHT